MKEFGIMVWLQVGNYFLQNGNEEILKKTLEDLNRDDWDEEEWMEESGFEYVEDDFCPEDENTVDIEYGDNGWQVSSCFFWRKKKGI